MNKYLAQFKDTTGWHGLCIVAGDMNDAVNWLIELSGNGVVYNPEHQPTTGVFKHV